MWYCTYDHVSAFPLVMALQERTCASWKTIRATCREWPGILWASISPLSAATGRKSLVTYLAEACPLWCHTMLIWSLFVWYGHDKDVANRTAIKLVQFSPLVHLRLLKENKTGTRKIMHLDLQQSSNSNTHYMIFNTKVNVISLVTSQTIHVSKVDLRLLWTRYHMPLPLVCSLY